MQGAGRRSPFLEEVRAAIRVRHYSIRTEQAYLDWIRRFILFHAKRHPREMAEPEVAAFLTHLAVERRVAPATQNLALNALVFLYRYVLERPLGEIAGIVRAARPSKLPVVLSPEEIGRVPANLSGTPWLVACLQYGSGLRLMESVRRCVRVVVGPGFHSAWPFTGGSSRSAARPCDGCRASVAGRVGVIQSRGRVSIGMPVWEALMPAVASRVRPCAPESAEARSKNRPTSRQGPDP